MNHSNIAISVLVFSGLSCGADWNPRLAAQYLDERQEAWLGWQPAASPDGACVSCHTGLTYLLVRPALREKLGEVEKTRFEEAILKRLRTNVGSKPDSVLKGVEVIFTALFLAREDGGQMSTLSMKGFDQLWGMQLTEGRGKGGWPWYKADLEPWETAGSFAYGAALAGLAIGLAPEDYQRDPTVRERISALAAYLATDWDRHSLHSRMATLWASSALPDLLPPARRAEVVQELLGKQESAGGWALDSLGPWEERAGAPVAKGSNAYATGFATYVLLKAGTPHDHPALVRASDWLKGNQDPVTGAWKAESMNKSYPAGSMESRFMQDAATSFAALALLERGD